MGNYLNNRWEVMLAFLEDGHVELIKKY
jgi:hypothetical protein